MTTPYVCAACRACVSIPIPRLQGVRRISQTASRRQTHQARNRNGAVSRAPDGTVSNRRNGRSENGAGNQNGTVRGRYSGKELKPEDLLNQLQISEDGRPARSQPRTPQPRAHTSYAGTPNRQRYTVSYRFGPKATAFIECCTKGDFEQAWAHLREIETLCSELPPESLQSLYTIADFVPACQNFGNICTKRWLDSIGFSSNSIAEQRLRQLLPSPSELLRTIHTIQARPVFRAVLWQAACGLVGHRFLGMGDEALAEALKELTAAWKICLAARLLRPASDTASTAAGPAVISNNVDWSFLPPPTVFASSRPERRTHDMFQEMLNMLVPSSNKNEGIASRGANSTRASESRHDYASAALVTLDLLRSVVVQTPNGSQPVGKLPECVPFVDLLSIFLEIAPSPALPLYLKNKIAGIEDTVMRDQFLGMAVRLNLANVPSPQDTAQKAPRSPEIPSAVQPDVEEPARASRNDPVGVLEDDGATRLALKTQPGEADHFALKNVTRLARAVERQDLTLAKRILRETFEYVDAQSNKRVLPLELYEHLMSAFLTLRNQEVAVGVWNHIVKLGYKPTTKTYTAMMRGALKSRDANGMEMFWRKMRREGVKPDEYAWSVRVFGLLKVQKRVQPGLQSLMEMGQEWFAAAKAKYEQEARNGAPKSATSSKDLAAEILDKYPGAVDGVPRPNAVVMNSAVTALAGSNDKEIPKVLSWGRSFRLEPDITTYNALLNISMRQGRADQAMGLVKRMQEKGIPPTSTTWTVLLTALFEGGFLDGLDHTKQQEKILAFINSLKFDDPATPSVDEKGYALIINHLLKRYDNQAAATGVLGLMTESGLEPTAHIYTILMASYFQQEPHPNFAAIEALWSQIADADSGWGAKLDSVFYDRMIEGFATHHRHVGMQRALDFLNRARRYGQKPSWKALEAVARALAEREQWDRLKALVDDVRLSLKGSRGAVQHFGQQNFWEFIIETGILREEGIFDPKQLLSEEARPSPLLAHAES